MTLLRGEVLRIARVWVVKPGVSWGPFESAGLRSAASRLEEALGDPVP